MYDLWFNFNFVMSFFQSEWNMIFLTQNDHCSCPLDQIALIDSKILSRIVPLESLDF